MEDVEGGLGGRVVAEGDLTAGSTGFDRGLNDHINPKKDVILRVEAMRRIEHKVRHSQQGLSALALCGFYL
jgi:hypothetical protein